ncbi:hypothetical protein ACET3Z_027981 [Daucus carota]
MCSLPPILSVWTLEMDSREKSAFNWPPPHYSANFGADEMQTSDGKSNRITTPWKYGDIFKKREDFYNVDRIPRSPQKRRKVEQCLLSSVFNYEVGMMQDRTVLKSKNIGFPTVSDVCSKGNIHRNTLLSSGDTRFPLSNDVCMKENVVPSSFSASKSTAQSTPCCPPQGSNAKKKKTLATNVMQQTASVHTPQQDLSNNGQKYSTIRDTEVPDADCY